MKKEIVLASALSLALVLSACSGGQGVTPTSAPTESVAVSEESSGPILPASETTDKIDVAMKVDEAMSQAVVTIANGSDYIFDGNVSVYFKNASSKQCGSDMIIVEDLKPGNTTYARISLTETGPGITMDYNISKSATFTEGQSRSEGALDASASSALSEDFEGSFGGAGNPQYATSWYSSCLKIEVYSSESAAYATVTVADDSTDEAINRIGNTIYGNYAKEYNLSSVTLVTESGNEVFLKSA